MQSAKTRLREFIEYQAVSMRKFFKECGISHSILTSNSAIGSDNLQKVSSAYPKLNMDWVVTGRGAMLLKEDENVIESIAAEPEHKLITKEAGFNAKYQKTILDSYALQIAFLKSQIADKEKIIELQNEKIEDFKIQLKK